jgi:hypothetical protein
MFLRLRCAAAGVRVWAIARPEINPGAVSTPAAAIVEFGGGQKSAFGSAFAAGWLLYPGRHLDQLEEPEVENGGDVQ